MSSPVRHAIRKSSRLVLLGPPCSGKGTLAQRLVRRYALPHISTGDILCPPIEEGVCDDCGEGLQQRPDDTREVAVERLRVYHQQSEPVVNFYRRRGRLRTIETEALLPELIYHRVIGEKSEV